MKIKLTSYWAFANTLTNLVPDLYEGLDIVSREQVGFIPSVTRNSSAERAAVNEVIRIPVSRAAASSNIVPAMSVPEPTDRTMDNVTLQITKSKAYDFGLVGEEQKGLDNGYGSANFVAAQFAQGVRALVNEMEQDIAIAAALAASRAYGTPGTTPFASGLGDLAQTRKILADNGAPLSDLQAIMDTTAGASVRTNQNLTRVSEAGTSMTLRQGELLNIHGFSLKESSQIYMPSVGTAAATASTTNAGYAVGSTAINVGAGGSGTILAGDYVTFAGDTNKYLVVGGVASVAAGGVLTLSAPGLRVAIPAATTAITVVAKSVRNVAFHPSAIQFVTRAPALPNGRDSAVDNMMITDPRSGMSFEVRVYEGYRKVRYEVGAAWGVSAIKNAHIAAFLG